jgi:hypothetical protein
MRTRMTKFAELSFQYQKVPSARRGKGRRNLPAGFSIPKDPSATTEEKDDEIYQLVFQY